MSLFVSQLGLCRIKTRYWKVTGKDLALINVHKEQLLSWFLGCKHLCIIPGNCMGQWTLVRYLLLVSQTTSQWKPLSSVNSSSESGTLHDFTLSTCYWIRLYTKHSTRHWCSVGNSLQCLMSQWLCGLMGLLAPQPLSSGCSCTLSGSVCGSACEVPQ